MHRSFIDMRVRYATKVESHHKSKATIDQMPPQIKGHHISKGSTNQRAAYINRQHEAQVFNK